MRIDSAVLSNVVAEQVEANNKPQSAKTQASAGAKQDDAVHTTLLSGDTDTVQALLAHASNLPDQRQGRIDALRASIQSGEYQASPEQVAVAMYSQLLR
jgi:flagellar biosynthesis anti-sigma factor FlgM